MGQIRLDAVSKSFGDVEVIRPLDLEISDGEFVVFVGPSGCGKSTLLRLIAGLEDVTSGRIEIDGADATAVPPAKRRLAMVFQSYALYPHMSVRKNIAFPLRMAGLGKDEQMRKVEEAARVLNLTEYLDRRPPSALRRATPAGRHRPGHRSRPDSVPVRTSRSRTSTRPCASICGSRSPSCTRTSRPPWSTSPTIRSRR